MSIRPKQKRKQKRLIDSLTKHPCSKWYLIKRFGVLGAEIIDRATKEFCKKEEEYMLIGSVAFNRKYNVKPSSTV